MLKALCMGNSQHFTHTQICLSGEKKSLRGLCWLTEAPGLHGHLVQEHEVPSDLRQAIKDRVLVTDSPPRFRFSSALREHYLVFSLDQ